MLTPTFSVTYTSSPRPNRAFPAILDIDNIDDFDEFGSPHHFRSSGSTPCEKSLKLSIAHSTGMPP